jgi:hypothetical protein
MDQPRDGSEDARPKILSSTMDHGAVAEYSRSNTIAVRHGSPHSQPELTDSKKRSRHSNTSKDDPPSKRTRLEAGQQVPSSTITAGARPLQRPSSDQTSLAKLLASTHAANLKHLRRYRRSHKDGQKTTTIQATIHSKICSSYRLT